tara:strand:+ start:540 stop:848 length:309 start_codon:yes stop_codon:yes gene_type:complete
MSIGLIASGLAASAAAGAVDSASGSNIGLALPAVLSAAAVVAEQREYVKEAASGGVITASPPKAGLMTAGATYATYLGGRVLGVIYQAAAFPEIVDSLNNLF